ncbi:hypothetical protein [Cyclobacterium roseum]|uniref:hypothetical protein n=1 Tax=Cyclobacterium roseum TaxID=2666137 RepID=UPI001391859A|nr:hypothetical protein [Cyclobacterium roseum]
MERRDFIGLVSTGGIATSAFPLFSTFGNPVKSDDVGGEMKADIIVAGGGLGGFAATMAVSLSDPIGSPATHSGGKPDSCQ